jgi:hypothetical protein
MALAWVVHIVHAAGRLPAFCREGEGVGPTAKGQQKRRLYEQFLFFAKPNSVKKFFYSLLSCKEDSNAPTMPSRNQQAAQ